MPVIITKDGRINVPKNREKPDGRTQVNYVSVKASGWVKYRKNGEFHHLPPNQVIEIQEKDPRKEKGVHGDTKYEKSNVSYQSPHGQV